MNIIIDKINEEIKKQGLTGSKVAELAGLQQTKVSRFLRGGNKKLDLEMVTTLQEYLGIVSESVQHYESDSFQISVNDDEKELLKCYRRLGADQKKSAYQMILGLVLLKQQMGISEFPSK